MKKPCTKCGVEIEIYGSRKYCYSCSPNFPKTKSFKTKDGTMMPERRVIPDLLCCHCGVVYGKGKWQKTQGNDKEPCDKCKDIVARKRLREKAKWDKRHKKEMSRWGKCLLEMEEEYRQMNAAEGCDYSNDNLFTRMRYVSEDELNMLRDNKCPQQSYSDDWLGRFCSHHDRCIKIVRLTGWYRGDDGSISKAGYYRVESTSKDDRVFTRVCNRGLPLAHNNNVYGRIKAIMDNRKRVGLEKFRDSMWIRAEREIKHETIERRRKDWMKRTETLCDRQFFQTLAMVEAVSK